MPTSQPSADAICQRLRQIQVEIARLIEERIELRAQLDPDWLEALSRTMEPQGVAYLGPEQSYSHSAARKSFGDTQSLYPVGTISAVFEEVHRGQSRYGVVPIENSTDGRIVDTMFNFIKRPLQICGEVLLPIHHNLLSDSDRLAINKVYSKPQALSQCRRWLSEHLPDAQRIEVASTTHAARIAKEEPGSAAIASLEASLEYGLPIVCASIEDDPSNATRFAIIGKDQPAITGRDKTALLFQVPHQPGALAEAMLIFKDNGINLTWIESLPVPGSPNEYYFFVEVEGHRDQAPMEDAIGALVQRSLRLDVLGSYPRGLEG
jgi:chorismate mutase/prephenate dehydratase